VSAYGGKSCSNKRNSTFHIILCEHENWRAHIQKQISPSQRENTLPTNQRQAHGSKGPHDMLNQLNFSPTPKNPYKEPTRSAPTKDGSKQPQKGVGWPLGRPTPHWALSGATFSWSLPPPYWRRFNLGGYRMAPSRVGRPLGSAEPRRLPGRLNLTKKIMLIH
jgi:hypothetical protein